MKNLLEHVEKSIRERKLFRRSERILVAVSGGLDSMTLLRVLHAFAPKYGWKLAVGHFNHQLRGRASDADERLVRETARALGLKFCVGRKEVKVIARSRGISIEMAARKVRHEFLAKTARRFKCRSIAVAHHADDQVELFFLRVLRGAGGEGLSGMKWRNPSSADATVFLARPLLDVGRADLEGFAGQNNIRFREDRTNTSRDILRNRIRHELLPLLRRRFQPALNKSVLRLTEIVGEEAEALGEAARDWLKRKHLPFSCLAVAVQRRAVQLQLQRQATDADFDLIESLRRAPGKPVSVGHGKQVICDTSGEVALFTIPAAKFKRGQREVRIKGSAGQGNFDGIQFAWEVAKTRGHWRLSPSLRREVFDADEVGTQIVLRHWKPGDRFRPIGMRGTVKLQDWFTNQKVARERRHKLVVGTTAKGEVFWVEGQRIGERMKVRPRTKRRLIWQWQRT